jgi:hypothetical protein
MTKSFIIKKRPTAKPPWVEEPAKPKLLVKPLPKLKAKPPKLMTVKPALSIPPEMEKSIHGLAVEREVFKEGSVKLTWKFPILSVNSTAQGLEISAITLAKWIKKEMLPAPVLKRTDTPIGSFYHVDEVLVMAELFTDHQRDFKYYREDHLDLRQKLSAKLGKVRAGLFQ